MNLVESVTQPLPPMGAATPLVPLSIEATLTEEPIQENIIPGLVTPFDFPYGVLISSVSVTASTSPGFSLFNYSSRRIFQELNLLSVVDSDKIKGFMPWNLVVPFYSKFTRMEYNIRHMPVKVADCRARIDIISTFDGTLPAYTTSSYQRPNVHLHLDDPSGQIDFQLPQVYVSNNVPTDMATIVDTYIPSPLVPNTASYAYLTLPYTPNALQPQSFEIVRAIYPMNNNTFVMAIKRTFKNLNDFTNMLRPYFL